MSTESLSSIELDPPDSIGLQFAFLALWLVDTVAATLFFVLPYATELNPVTVFFYELFGLPGVAVAAVCYAAVVMAVGHFLSHPHDVAFVALIVVAYAAFAMNNVPLILFEETLPELLHL